MPAFHCETSLNSCKLLCLSFLPSSRNQKLLMPFAPICNEVHVIKSTPSNGTGMLSYNDLEFLCDDSHEMRQGVENAMHPINIGRAGDCFLPCRDLFD